MLSAGQKDTLAPTDFNRVAKLWSLLVICLQTCKRGNLVLVVLRNTGARHRPAAEIVQGVKGNVAFTHAVANIHQFCSTHLKPRGVPPVLAEQQKHKKLCLVLS